MSERPLEHAARLRPYLPRMLIEWLAEAPGTMLREVDGTVVFVDISGFTKMSERLARSGKVGAEEVADVIGAVFARLLSVAYGEFGGLIKFGGDALLLLFTGDDHPLKGARAAVGMRQALRAIGPIDTTAGKVTLRMSVGLHSGTFQLYLVGETHRELIITGPAATETVSMEGTAVAGEILASRATADLLPRAALGRPKEDGILLRSTPMGLPGRWPAPERSLEGVDLLSCIPTALREHVLSGDTDPEHRQVTVAFIHYDGIDELVREGGAEAVAFGLDELVRVAQAACEKNGVTFLGSDVDKDGGKIILVAGAPSAHGDDEERMLLTARAIVDAETTIAIRIGVNRGHVFSGDIGPSYRRTYTVMGDGVNLAARVMAKAEPGQVLATVEVLDSSNIGFNELALEPFMVKGKSQPVHAFIVGQPIGARAAETSFDLPLVGRDAELEVFRSSIDDLREGRGSLIELVGNPGIGKTRLVNELRSMATELPLMLANCDRYEASSPYLPFRRLFRLLLGTQDEEGLADRLREHVEAVAPELLPWLPLLAVVADVDVPDTPEVELLGEDFRKPKLEEVTADFLTRALTEPTVVALEDVHWMDEGSRDLLRYLAHGMAGRPWLVCVTRRDEDTGFTAPEGDGCRTLRPQPLSSEEAVTLIGLATEDNPILPHEASTLAERSAGNPFFLQELLVGMRHAGGIEGLPDSVEGMVVAEIDRLASGDRLLLRFASVLGAAFSDELVQGMLAEEAYELDEAAWKRLDPFVMEVGTGLRRFRHALMRDAAYEGLPFRRRRELHARVSELLLAREGSPEAHAELLSLHFFSAQRFPEALEYSRVAGEHARAKFAMHDAAEFYERASVCARRADDVADQEKADLFETLGDLRERTGEYGAAASAYTAARRLVGGNAVQEGRLLRKHALISDKIGRAPEALRWLARGLNVLEDRDTIDALQQRARLMNFYGAIRQGQGRHADAIRWCRDALVLAERSQDKGAIAHAYGLIDWALVDLGRTDEAVYSVKAAELFAEIGNRPDEAWVYNQLGMFAQLEGRWDDATTWYEKSTELLNSMGDAVEAAIGIHNAAEIQSDRGHLKEAEATFKETMRVFRAADYRLFVAYCEYNLGRVALRGGRFEEAEVLFAEAKAGFHDIGGSAEEIETDARVAESRLLQGRGAEILERAADALERLRAHGGGATEPLLLRIRGYALMQTGALPEADEALRESLAVARARNAAFEVALTLDAIARLEILETGIADLDVEREAAEIFERLGVIFYPEVPLRGPGGLSTPVPP